MANKRLRFFSILAACCFSIVGVSAYVADWTGPVTITQVDSFVAVAADSLNDLYISSPGASPVTIQDHVTIDAMNADLRVFIGEQSNGTQDTIAILQPHATDGGNLIFHAPTGRKIDVWIPATYDFFTQANTLDMNVTFSGDGMTTFHIGGMDPEPTNPFGTYGYGRVVFSDTNVWITMDQTQTQAETNHENKLVFQRGGYLGADTWTDANDLYLNDYNNTFSGWPVIVQFDPNSDFIYVSPQDGTTGYEPQNDAAVAFDPSNNGLGLMELVISDSTGFVIAGHWMDATYFANPTAGNMPASAVSLNFAAGHKAIFRTIDDLSSNAISGYVPDNDTRRGLLIVNQNAQFPQLASDPYSNFDIGLHSYFDTGWPNVRKGFILGLNGDVDVYNNRFIHYFSYSHGGLPDVDPIVFDSIAATFPTYNAASFMKPKNPAAFVVDGFNQFTGLFLIPTYPFPYQDYNAQITLRGDARLHLSAALGEQELSQGALQNYDYLFPQSIENSTGYTNGWGLPYDFYPDSNYEYFFSGLAGGDPSLTPQIWDPVSAGFANREGATYNGDWVALDTAMTMSGEGIHVLDVEGPVDVRSIDDSPNVGTALKEGVINLATMQLDVKGQEATYDWNGANQTYDRRALTRPLTYNSYYPVYRSPSMLFNDVASFYDVEIRHNDVLKRVVDRPIYCEPAMVGGDRKFLWEGLLGYGDGVNFPPVEFPELRIYNSSLTLHESVSPTGVRFVVKQYSVPGATAPNDQIDNVSSFVFFNHGDDHDMQWRGFARAFVLGNPHSYMADSWPNWVLESASVDVFRSENLPLDNGDPVDRTIMLSLLQDDEDQIRALGDKREGTHLFLLTQGPLGISNMSLGWTTSRGHDEVNTPDDPYTDPATGARWARPWYPMPWNMSGTPPSNEGVDIDASTLQKGTPINHEASVSPVILSIDGNQGTYDNTWIYFGSRKYDYQGDTSPSPIPYWTRDWKEVTDPYLNRYPVLSAYQSPVLYVNHGGKIQVTGYNDSIFDTVIAPRLWYDYLSTDWESTPESQRYSILSGIVDLPHDQVKFTEKGSIQPYGYTEAMSDVASHQGGILRLKAYMPERTTAWDQASGEEMTIDWARRPIDYNQDPFKGRVKKSKASRLKRIATRTVATRATKAVTQPVDIPSDLLYLAEGDHIRQLRVAGATQADPFHIFVTGAASTHGFAIIDEIVSVKTENLIGLPPIVDYSSDNYKAASYGSIPGEGGHGVIIFDADARVGLGSRAWNEHSVNAWNKLGQDYVTLVPYGFGKVIVNSDLLVADPLAIIPAVGFGEVRDEIGDLVEGSFERLTFYSEDEHEIRVPANGALDLRAFGKRSNTGETTAIRQEIAFSGKTKLVLEHGATIRFPNEVDDNVTFVLYFNDESQLIFEGAKENGAERFIDAPDANEKRIKLMGKGEIWVNKDAKIKVNGAAWVGVQADNENIDTKLTISLQRQGSMEIGTDQLAGGAFEVGNPVNSEEATIDFSLIINGPRAEFHIDREGFFGLGAGIINKEGNINGDALEAQNPASFNTSTGRYVFNPDNLNAWEVHPLYNVNYINIDVEKGIFDHSNIFDGSDRRASLMAISGPYYDYTGPAQFLFTINDPTKCIIRGGGNMMWIPEGHDPVAANVWSWAGVTEDEGGIAGNSIYYSILASEPIMNQQEDGDFENSTIVQNSLTGRTFTSGSGAAWDFYNFMAYNPYPDIPIKYVCVGQTEFDVFDGYVNRVENVTNEIYDYPIVRESAPHAIEGGVVEDGVHIGVLGATGADAPSQYLTVGGHYTH